MPVMMVVIVIAIRAADMIVVMLVMVEEMRIVFQGAFEAPPGCGIGLARGGVVLRRRSHP